MKPITELLYTGTVTTDGARTGRARSDDGTFDVAYKPPVPGPWSDLPGTNPEELLAAAWAICFHGLYALNLGRRGGDATGVRVRVSVDLGHTEESSLGLAADVAVEAPGVDHEVARAVLQEAFEQCPFCQSMHDNMPVVLRVLESAPPARERS
jgi:osmotically inducible protein OsmC